MVGVNYKGKGTCSDLHSGIDSGAEAGISIIPNSSFPLCGPCLEHVTCLANPHSSNPPVPCSFVVQETLLLSRLELVPSKSSPLKNMKQT